MSSASPLVVKWDHCGQIRRFSLPTTEGDVFTALMNKVRELRADLQSVQLQLFYVDGEGDSILFSSADELRDALARLQQGATFKVFTAADAEDGDAEEVIVVEEEDVDQPRKTRIRDRSREMARTRSRSRSSPRRRRRSVSRCSSSSSSSSDSSSDEAKRGKKQQKKQEKKMKKKWLKSWHHGPMMVHHPLRSGPKWMKKLHGRRFGGPPMPPPPFSPAMMRPHPPAEFFLHGPPPPFARHFRAGPSPFLPPVPHMPDHLHPHRPHHHFKRFAKHGAKMHRRQLHHFGFGC